MYFINDQHKTNFGTLLKYYGKKAENEQYGANIYLAAVPEIFELLNDAKINSGDRAPLVTLMEYSDKHDKLVPSHAGLTGSTIKLLEVGMSLFNGRSCDLDFTPSKEYGLAVLQAMRIRYLLERADSTWR